MIPPDVPWLLGQLIQENVERGGSSPPATEPSWLTPLGRPGDDPGAPGALIDRDHSPQRRPAGRVAGPAQPRPRNQHRERDRHHHRACGQRPARAQRPRDRARQGLLEDRDNALDLPHLREHSFGGGKLPAPTQFIHQRMRAIWQSPANPSSMVCAITRQSTADLTTPRVVAAWRNGTGKTVSARRHDRREEAIGGCVLEPLGTLVDEPRASVHGVRTRTSPRYRAAASAR